jgi:Uri superfamily endonuclease
VAQLSVRPVVSTYLLIMQGNVACRLWVGALGEVCLEPGWYLYVGSARRYLDARLRRHLRLEKRRRWHIDYLLAEGALKIKEIWLGEAGAECRLAGSLLALPEVTRPRPRLGASDCRCLTHFFRYSNDLPKLQQFLVSLGLAPYSPT